MGGSGVALLLASAAVLTAVRWDDIGQSAKLGGLVAITAALLGVGQRLKRTLPMTADAIFHLGALLIPFDMAAIAILAGRSWQGTLLLTTLTSVVGWYSIHRAVPSIVLRTAAACGVIGLAAGIAAVSPLAMAVALAAAAIVGLALHQRVEATVWATLAVVLPNASFVPWPPRLSGAAMDLGFDELAFWQPLAAGVMATATLAVVTRQMPRVELAWLTVAAAATTALTALDGVQDPVIQLLAAGVAFIAIGLAAIACRNDELWAPITRLIAVCAEVVMAVTTIWLGGLFLIEAGISGLDDYGPAWGSAAVLIALGWLVADNRNLDQRDDWLFAALVGSDQFLTTVCFPIAVMVAAAAFGASAPAVGLVAVTLGFWMTSTWRRFGALVACAFVGMGMLCGLSGGPLLSLLVALLGAIVLMNAAGLELRKKEVPLAVFVGTCSVMVWFFGAMPLVAKVESTIALLVAVAWALSWFSELPYYAPQRVPSPVHHIGRGIAAAIAALSLSPAGGFGAGVGVWVCLAIIVPAIIDYLLAVRAGAAEGSMYRVAPLVVAGAALGASGQSIGELLGMTTAQTGAAMTAVAFVLLGTALALPREAEKLLGVAAATATVFGVLLAVPSPPMLAVAMMSAGCSLTFVAAALRNYAVGVAGFIAAGLGVSLQLAVWEVTWLEPYLVFPTIAAVAVGHRYQRSGGTSWAAYVPTVVILSYVSVAERVAGGSAWHAVIAGAIGVVATIAGGYRKLVGPLLAGPAVLAVVVIYEGLGPGALVPTWAWLALGGTVLLIAGVLLERSDTTPLERGQQLRHVLATQFS